MAHRSLQKAANHVPRGLVPVLEVGEVRRALAVAEAAGPFRHALLATGYFCGLRAGEYGRIRLDGVDLRRGIFINAEKGGMSGVCGFLPDLIDMVPILSAWKEVHPGGGWLFPALSDQTKGIHRSRVFELVRELLGTAGLHEKARYPHILRQSIGTHLFDAGASRTFVKAHLRHRDLASTDIYIKFTKAARDEGVQAAKKIGAILRGDAEIRP